MYNVKWDKENNGVLLTEDKSSLKAPRPVFVEELNFLGFDEYYRYDQGSVNPLIWNINRKYYYKGKHIATAKGGDLFNKPRLRIFKDDLDFHPIDIEDICRKNFDLLQNIYNKTQNFITKTVEEYNQYLIGVGYSGGKDSQVLLDLVNRSTLNDFSVVFSDTTLEHDYTYENVDKTMELYNNLNFNIVKPKRTATELFELMGLPSRFRKWCTSALKTAPFNTYIGNLMNNGKFLIIEGVRRDESRRRAKYDYIGADESNPNLIKIRPILDWSTTEVFLYILKNNIPLNKLYKTGLRRVGCEICPNSGGWSEGILGNIDDNYMNKYGRFIKRYAIDRGLKTDEEINEAIIQGYWKKRAGGRYGDFGSEAIFVRDGKKFIATLINPQKEPLEYLNLVGEVEDNIFIFNEDEFEFETKTYDDRIIIIFKTVNKSMQKMVRKALKKATYCIDCGMCDSLCFKTKCDKCGVCLEFTYHACLRASSLYKTKQKT